MSFEIVTKMKGCNLDLGSEAHFPCYYVLSGKMKISLYSEEKLEDLGERVKGTYGRHMHRMLHSKVERVENEQGEIYIPKEAREKIGIIPNSRVFVRGNWDLVEVVKAE